MQVRSRSKIPGSIRDHGCKDVETEQRGCMTNACEGPCETTRWSEFTECSKPCGVGSRNRTRTFVSCNPNCTEHLIEWEDCNIECCPGKVFPSCMMSAKNYAFSRSGWNVGILVGLVLMHS